jgi:hypothetical protein
MRVTPDNLDPETGDVFDRSFLMKAGDLCNPDYVTQYLY